MGGVSHSRSDRRALERHAMPIAVSACPRSGIGCGGGNNHWRGRIELLHQLLVSLVDHCWRTTPVRTGMRDDSTQGATGDSSCNCNCSRDTRPGGRQTPRVTSLEIWKICANKPMADGCPPENVCAS